MAGAPKTGMADKNGGLFESLAVGDPVEVLALHVAKDEYPNLSIEQSLMRLDGFADSLVRARLAVHSPTEQAEALAHRLCASLGFQGNESDYYEPRNSYLNDVIEKRIGIPITLAMVMMAVGRRAGIHVEGIGFPGHFLVRVGGPEGVFVDPFFGGRVLTDQALARLAHKFLGDPHKLTKEHLGPVDSRSMIVRLLVNLKHVHERRQDHARALVVSDRLVDMTASHAFRRDRGLHALALGAAHAAIADLEAYLEDLEDAPDAAAVRRAIQKAKGKSALVS